MQIKAGIDIVHIPRIAELMQNKAAVNKTFHKSELKTNSPEHLAGIFAAKEAVMKALDLKAGSWKKIEISHLPSGKPFVKLYSSLNQKKIESCDISISHHGDYVLSVAVFLIR